MPCELLRRVVLALCTLILWAAPGLGAAAPDSFVPEAASVSNRQLSAREVLALAQFFGENGEDDKAERIYEMLKADPHEEIRLEASFQLAQMHLRQGKVRQAIRLFREILTLNPNLTRVRLELARAYFLDKNYKDAAFQFELVKGGDLPPEVTANVDSFLNAIRRQKNWTVDFALSPVSDSNINQASGGREECIDTAFGRLCRPLEEKSSGVGATANASVDYFWRFHQNWGLRGTADIYVAAYEQEEYNDCMVHAGFGPRYLWNSGEASLQATFLKRWVGDREYVDECGLRFDARQVCGRFLIDIGAAVSFPRYADDYVHDILKGVSWNAYIQNRYIVSDRTVIQVGANFAREKARMAAYANDNWRWSLGFYRIFPYGLSLFAEGSLTDTAYQDSQWFVTRDNRFSTAVRKDKTWQAVVSLSSTILDDYHVTPVVRYVYTKRTSNIWTREYERSRLSLSFNYQF